MLPKKNTEIKWRDWPLKDKIHQNVEVEDKNGKLVTILALVDKPKIEPVPASVFDIQSILDTGNTQLLQYKFKMRHDINSIDAALRLASDVEASIDKLAADEYVNQQTSSTPNVQSENSES